MGGGRANHQSESGEETEDGAKRREREGGFRKEEEVDYAHSSRQKDKWTLRTCTQSMCKCARGGILGRRISSYKYAGPQKDQRAKE